MTITRHAYAILGLVTVLSAISLSSGHLKGAARSQPLAVQVVNATTSPIPTRAQGTTTVAGTVAVSSVPAVQIAADQVVGIAGEPTVHIDANNIVPVKLKQGRTPIIVTKQLSMATGTGDNFNSYGVPSGKRLIITSMFGIGRMSAGDVIANAQIGQVPMHFSTPIADYASIYNSDAYEQCDISYEENTGITFFAGRNTTAGNLVLTMGFSGYLEDM